MPESTRSPVSHTCSFGLYVYLRILSFYCGLVIRDPSPFDQHQVWLRQTKSNKRQLSLLNLLLQEKACITHGTQQKRKTKSIIQDSTRIFCVSWQGTFQLVWNLNCANENAIRPPLVSFAAVIRVVTHRSSPLTAAHSSSAFLSPCYWEPITCMYLLAARQSYFSLHLPPKTSFPEYGSLLLIGQFEERNAEFEWAAVFQVSVRLGIPSGNLESRLRLRPNVQSLSWVNGLVFWWFVDSSTSRGHYGLFLGSALYSYRTSLYPPVRTDTGKCRGYRAIFDWVPKIITLANPKWHRKTNTLRQS